MIAVIFEVIPREGQKGAYLGAAASLRHHLDRVDGFLSIERFESLAQPGKFLSLSFWRDEEAVRQWRTLEEHRRMQQAGRQNMFEDYRLRVAGVIRDYGMLDRTAAPEDSKALHG
jgi:heme-degrading monooxygenase HmoA